MLDLFSFWYLLPVGIAIATIYTSTGISGANFWAPVYLLWIEVDPLMGFWLSLVSMLFGSTGGLIGHTRHKTINYHLVRKYVIITVPFAALGGILLQFVDVVFLFIIFGMFVISYGLYLFYHAINSRGENIAKNEKIHYLLGSVGGFLTGLISVGLGSLLLPKCINHQKIVHHSEAVGTTLVVVFVTSLVAVMVRLNPMFVESLRANLDMIASMLIYVIPGVLTGGQIGPIVAKQISLRSMRTYVSLVLLIIGILMFVRAFSW